MRSAIVLCSLLVAIQIFSCYGAIPNSRLNFFDIDLLRYAAENKKGNVLLSPASLKSTLAMILEGAEGSTAEELKLALRVSPEKDDFRDELSLYVGSLQANSSNVLLESTNALFLSKKLKIKKEFDTMVRRFYHSEVGILDFSNPKSAADLINAWVNTKTKGLIPSIVEEVQLPPTTDMVLANALFFRGSWKHGFNAKYTHGDCFYVEGVCNNVAMMDLQAELRYAFVDNLRSHALELPYKGDRYSMILLVPQDRDTGMAMLRDLPYVGLPQIIDSMYPNDVVLTMPKFDVEYNEDLVQALKSMRVTSLFSQFANLSGIYESDGGPHINSIFHSVHMKVDETGTVAAAATASLIVPLINNQVQLQVDRPFVFFIRDNNLGINLFEGKIEKPTKYEETGSRAPPKVSVSSKPVSIPPFGRHSTTGPPPPSQQSFHEANPNYDHGGPYQPTLYQHTPHRTTLYKSSKSEPFPARNSSDSFPTTLSNPNQNEPTQSEQRKQSNGITGFFKRLGSYFTN